MQAKVARTLEEPQGTAPPEVRLLCRVLCYDDLLAQGTKGPEVYPLTGVPLPLHIGRSADEEQAGLCPEGPVLRLLDRFLSARHALLCARKGTYLVRDQHSRNGTFVNGVRIEEQVLGDGDLIEVGHTLLCYRVLPERLFHELVRGVSGGVAMGPTRTCCAEMVQLVQELHRVAPSAESVLLLSESGTGKEVAAQMLHTLSGREGACCTVDAGAVPESLFESAFFGHRRGAFTGAATDQTGHLLRAHRGTLFLDEVANMSPSSQAKLLRVIEDGKVTPLGAQGAQQVDLRWVAATNVNLFLDTVPFRKDLLRRLAGYVARIPPLRRRREDLGVLSAHFLREAGVKSASITAPAGRRLFTDPLPGNVRQLRSLLRSAVVLSPDGPIDLVHLSSLGAAEEDLPPQIPMIPTGPMPLAPPPADEPDPSRRPPPTPEEIDGALSKTRGNVVRAAQRLDLHPRQLYRWIERLQIDLRRYRE